MAHSHRPQINAAKAFGDRYGEGSSLSIGLASEKRSQRDGGDTKLKFRQVEQGLIPSTSLDELQRRELEAAAAPSSSLQSLEDYDRELKLKSQALLREAEDKLGIRGDSNQMDKKGDAKEEEQEEEEEEGHGDSDLDEFDDRDDEISSESEESSDSDSGDSDHDEDEEILKELARIRKEREEKEEAARRLQKEDEELQAKMSGMKRRWDADVVFHNQARTQPEKTKRFINDTIRNDFHRNFLKKYVR